ncbi:hypothetical protein GMDG_05888 [Pseudogymnoascus destructans 20631-21]|uniref:HIT-type domain-containing protein n=1 Tax=Pseudogymnoascus destructans (strain ATCC MYA-4855 / 20631-21) TaxID=658429 RepID=L8FTK4_PSED2|nr:hypothetical protein GMDG_05888 [Pseudogymnoascus destructans 20631-21]
MDLFGVHDLPTSKSASAGWAYIPDTLSSAAAPASRKRARHTASAHDQSARQDAKIARDLAALEREGGGGRDEIEANMTKATHGKVTPAVRKILQSQKTFANHLSDAEALATLAPPPSSAAAAVPSTTTTAAAAATPPPAPTAPSSKRKYKRRSLAAGSTSTPSPTKSETPQPQQDTDMPDADTGTLLAIAPRFTPHPGDSDPLLRSRIPSMPTSSEVETLLAERPRGYLEAKAGFDGATGGGRVKGRRFCEVCGYWGRVRCMACGTRCCALECLGVHREVCFGGYGA